MWCDVLYCVIGFDGMAVNEVEVLNELAQLVAQGKLQVPMDTIIPFTTEGLWESSFEEISGEECHSDGGRLIVFLCLSGGGWLCT